MKNAGETIERVLSGLRVAEPPTGMHRRIHDAMQTHEVVGSTASLSWRVWNWRAAVAAGVLAMAALWIVTITVPRHPPEVIHLSANRSANRSASRSAGVVARQASTPPLAPTRTAIRKPAAHIQPVSYPAPPLPLTEQERLLLHLAHSRDANNMAVLNPEMRSAQTAKATIDFQHFFDIDPKEMRSQLE